MWAVSLKITAHAAQFIHDSIDLMRDIFVVREGGTRAVLNADVVACLSGMRRLKSSIDKSMEMATAMLLDLTTRRLIDNSFVEGRCLTAFQRIVVPVRQIVA